jgi:hypothetical protein
MKVNICAFSHILGSPSSHTSHFIQNGCELDEGNQSILHTVGLCNRSHLNFLIYEEIVLLVWEG